MNNALYFKLHSFRYILAGYQDGFSNRPFTAETFYSDLQFFSLEKCN